MNIGLLNIRITIQKNELITDEIGNQIDAWTDYFSCAATIGNEVGSESEKAGETVEDTSATFTVRYCPETLAVTSTGYRIIFQNEIYNITGVDHMNFKRKSIKMRCTRARR